MNTFFVWDKDFETGNELVDGQHYGLIQMINDFMKLDLTDKSNAMEKITIMKDRVAEYVVSHFRDEESIMKEYAVDVRHLDKHKKLHQDFVAQMKIYSKNIADYLLLGRAEEVVEYLIRWLAYHILNTDKSLFRQIDNIKKGNLTPEEAYDLEEKNNEVFAEPLLKALKALYTLVTEKNKELELKNEELEETVKQRTQELTEANIRLQNLSVIDELTGLYNRRFAMTELERLLYDWERYQELFSIIYLDADKFKSVNDTHGHETGDLVLKWISGYLKSSARKTDYVCRLGGDEFLIICVHHDSSHIRSFGQKLLDRYNNDKELRKEIEQFWKPSLSIGVATIEQGTGGIEDLLKKADNAMYYSKKRGGNSITFSCDI